MEKQDNETRDFKENGVEQEPQQQEAQSGDDAQKEADGQPDKKVSVLKKVIVYLIVIAAVGVPVALIIRYCHNKAKYEYEYDYSYGEEPSDGHISYKNGKSNIINPTTKEVIVKEIDWSHYSDNNDEEPIVLFAKNGKRGFCNISTNEVIVQPTTYTEAWIFSEGLAAVEKDNYIGFVNTKGEVVIDFRFSYRGNSLYEFVFHNGYCVVADSSNKVGVIDKKGRWVIQPLYNNIELTKDYAIVYKEGDFKKQVDFNGHVLQEGIIDDIYELYYDVQYTDLQSGEPQLGSAKNNDFYEYRVGSYSGLIDSKGKVITPPIYTDITGITPTLFKATLKDWMSIVIIDTKGNVISTTGK